MEKTEVLAMAMGMARAGLGFTPAAGLDCICALIGQEDPLAADHDQNVEQLLRLAACIWSLRHALLGPASAAVVHSQQLK
jgi:hypothetical protein